MKIKRDIYKELTAEINKPFISILIGPRQVGKTFLMRQLEANCRRSGLKTLFHNLEDPDDLRSYSGDEQQLIKQLKNIDADVLFLDEFHYLKNATRIFKVLYDSRIKVKIFASGSSSMEIHKHLKESCHVPSNRDQFNPR
ncbi:MAG: AAA family ATPase [Nitrospirae bacterium]|nr:AAA family ATPase [Nitrospirota bacterium]